MPTGVTRGRVITERDGITACKYRHEHGSQSEHGKVVTPREEKKKSSVFQGRSNHAQVIVCWALAEHIRHNLDWIVVVLYPILRYILTV